MVRFLVLLLLTSCSFFNQPQDQITEQDMLIYDDYLEYLKIARGGQRLVSNSFGADKKYKYYYKDFKEIDMRVLVFKNLLLNQQYVVVYSDYLKKNINQYKSAESIKALNLKAEVNKEALDAYILIEEFLEPKLEKRIKKIFIGNEVGGAVLNITALSLIANSGFRQDEIEVISFGTPSFSSGRLGINSSFVNLDTDETPKLNVFCCSGYDGSKVLNLKNTAKIKQTDKLLSYQQAARNL